jgi:hypothetical protein
MAMDGKTNCKKVIRYWLLVIVVHLPASPREIFSNNE